MWLTSHFVQLYNLEILRFCSIYLQLYLWPLCRLRLLKCNSWKIRCIAWFKIPINRPVVDELFRIKVEIPHYHTPLLLSYYSMIIIIIIRERGKILLPLWMMLYCTYCITYCNLVMFCEARPMSFYSHCL